MDSVQNLGVEFGKRFIDKALALSDEGKLIAAALEEKGLSAQSERAHTFSIFSAESLKSIAVGVMPFTTKDLKFEAGLSISEGGHAQAVIVEIKDRTEIVAFTHLAVVGGHVESHQLNANELPSYTRPGLAVMEEHIKSLAERAGKIKAAKPLVEIDTRQVRSIAALTYNSLLGDSFSRSVHSEDEITKLRGNTQIVSEIGLFVLFRTSGSSCCSCSCSCWGSSSCSSSYGG
jgi:hypothetical protein